MVRLNVVTLVLILWLVAGVCWSVAFYRLRLRFEVRRRLGTRPFDPPLSIDDRAELVRSLLPAPGERIFS